MNKLTDEELKRIVNRATLFQKIYRNAPGTPSSVSFQAEYPNLFEITDSLNLERAFVYEAMLEHVGIPVEEPIAIDAAFGAFMLFAAALVEGGNDTPPMVIGSLVIFAGSILYSRFVTNRKKKRKTRLSDLVERLQLIFERKAKSQFHQSNSSSIEIPEDVYSDSALTNESNSAHQQRE